MIFCENMARKALNRLATEVSTYLQNGVTRSIKGLKGELFQLNLDRFLYDFKDERANEKWLTVSDKDFGGKSLSLFEKSQHGHCVFKGELSTALPGDEDTKYSGFCAIKSLPDKVYTKFNLFVMFPSLGSE